MNLLRKILIALVIFDLALGANFKHYAFAGPGAHNQISVANSESSGSAGLPYERVLKELDSAQPGQLPKNTTDAFHLLDQSLEVFDGRFAGKYNLDRLDISLPQIAITDFDAEVRVSINPKTKVLEFNYINKAGKTLAKHSFNKIEVVSYAIDKEVLVLLDRSGKALSLDMGYVREYVFKSPLPVVELLKTNLVERFGEHLAVGFINRKLEPFDSTVDPDGHTIVPLDVPLTAGDLAIWSITDKGRSMVAGFNRSVIKTQLYTAEAMLAMMAFQFDPTPEKEGVMEGVKLLSLPQSNGSENNMGNAYQEILAGLPARAVNRLLTRAMANKANINNPRDQFYLDEWRNQFTQMLEKSKNEQQAAVQAQLPKWREAVKTPADLFHKVITSRATKTMATIILASTTVYAVDSLQYAGQGVIWATHLINEVYNLYIPDVIKDSSYRVTLLKSSLALSAFVPLVLAAGHLYAKVKGVTWSAQKSLATMSMRIYGALMLPFWHYLAQIVRQPNFIRSLQLGINPLTKISKDSVLGQKLGVDESVIPAFNNPFLNQEKMAQKLESNVKIQNAIYSQKSRTRALAWALALQTVSEEFKVDPVSISTLIDSNGIKLSDQQIEKLTESPEFKRAWMENANELYVQFSRMKKNEIIEDFNKIDPQELAQYYAIAKETTRLLKQRSNLSRVFGRLVIHWRNFSENTIVGLANFGINEHRFLKSAEPSDFVTSQFWKQFISDYLLSIGQVGVIGDRANLNDPQALAADEKSLLWTTPGHRFDMIDQVRIYMINVPARLALVYQNLKEVSENSYDPVENKSMLGTEKSESFWAGMKEWTKSAGNIVQAGYGFIWNRSLLRTVKSLQANLIMAAIGRIVFGGQSLLPALGAFTYGFVWAQWQFGWLWEPVNRGNQMYQERLDQQKEKFLSAKAKLAKALRLDNLPLIAEASDELAAFYDDSFGKRDVLDRITGEGLRILRDVDSEEMAEMQQNMKLNKEALKNLQQALLSGDPQELEKTRLKIVETYQVNQSLNTNDLVQIGKMDAVALLEFALKTPPFVTQPNAMVEWTTTMAGALITTYWGTTMSVLTFRPDISWTEKIAEAGVLSALLYAGTYYGQKALNWSSQKIQVWTAKPANNSVGQKCEALF
jgi:hypothetical protein